ncbi:hypothetical protein MTO96_027811 [Rhipicephalus appendiculatus]
MCREFVSTAVPKTSGAAAADMCVLKFPTGDGAARTNVVRKEEGGGPPPSDKENSEELAVPKKIVSAPSSAVSFAAIADSCGSSLLLNIRTQDVSLSPRSVPSWLIHFARW